MTPVMAQGPASKLKSQPTGPHSVSAIDDVP
jgi:hypothetical protein